MNQKKWSIFNKSSEDMSEVKDNSVDLIVASVPFNIETPYPTYTDNLALKDYVNMLSIIFSECEKKLKETGTMVVEVIDSVLMNGQYVLLSALVQDLISSSNKFHLNSRHIDFLRSENGVELVNKSLNSDSFIANSPNCHSNCIHWLVFEKRKKQFKEGRIFYYNYYENNSFHPCPFPDSICVELLNMYYKNGGIVLDPFMGIGTIGKHVLKSDGSFIGYEIDAESFVEAKELLERTHNQE